MDRIKLYRAGLRLVFFIEVVENKKMPFHAECVLVSSGSGNPDMVFGSPVVEVKEASFHEDDVILLTMSDVLVIDARKLLAEYDITESIYRIDYTMIGSILYAEIYKFIEPFVDGWSEWSSGFNSPVGTGKRYVWSCWWQGEDNAPQLVKKCWECQGKNIPEGVEHIIIIWENYRNYIEFPEYIIINKRFDEREDKE